jgi:hypothetical protein
MKHMQDSTLETRMIRVSLSRGDWRKVRVWAAEADMSVPRFISSVLRSPAIAQTVVEKAEASDGA